LAFQEFQLSKIDDAYVKSRFEWTISYDRQELKVKPGQMRQQTTEERDAKFGAKVNENATRQKAID
jgi:hypothetical protein